MAYEFRPKVVVDLMGVKGLKKEAYSTEGFNRDWIRRKSRSEKPRAPDAVRLAVWLEVPTELLFGAAPEYDGMAVWEIASRTSLEVFLKRHPEGRQLAQRRKAFEDHIAAQGEKAPRTVAIWAASVDLFARLRGEEVQELRRLDALGARGDVSPGVQPAD